MREIVVRFRLRLGVAAVLILGSVQRSTALAHKRGRRIVPVPEKCSRKAWWLR